MRLEALRHIAVEGAIGVGKTSLARRLALHLGYSTLLERPEDNPFLERYYAEGGRYAMPAQLAFLFQRVEQMRELAQPGMFERGAVSDFVFSKDALFASLTLSADEFALYAQVHAHVAPARPPEPDLVIWLRASPPSLLERIRRRGIAMEQGIGLDYLERLDAAYAEHFERAPEAPLLAVETEDFHPAARESDFVRLIERMAAFEGPREAYRPGEVSLV